MERFTITIPNVKEKEVVYIKESNEYLSFSEEDLNKLIATEQYIPTNQLKGRTLEFVIAINDIIKKRNNILDDWENEYKCDYDNESESDNK